MNTEEYLLGIDIGSSFVKASLVRVATGRSVASAQSPAAEMPMLAMKPGWAEQDPDLWWEHVVASIRNTLLAFHGRPEQIRAIGISYQMHGLVITSKDHKPLRPAIIWCDSRAVPLGERAFNKLGHEFCLTHYLNSPGNFTASKLRWVKENEPALFARVDKAMLPGDYIALRMTGEAVTSETGLSEGIFWDYILSDVAVDLLEEFELDRKVIPPVAAVFSIQGKLLPSVAGELGLAPGTPIAYRAGDQPNNAFSLNVLEPGEAATTAGTSGVIYSVTDQDAYDRASRVNTFIHVNNQRDKKRNGILLCVNGTGILNNWLRRNVHSGSPLTYEEINRIASESPVGANGLMVLPFGNGAERMLENRLVGASIHGLNFNQHTQSHMFRAAQEGIVFSLRYGFDILKEMGVATHVIRAGKANLFLSPLFREAFANTIGVNLELYDTDGATGAALGAGLGAGIYKSPAEALASLGIPDLIQPQSHLVEPYNRAYESWKKILNEYLAG